MIVLGLREAKLEKIYYDATKIPRMISPHISKEADITDKYKKEKKIGFISYLSNSANVQHFISILTCYPLVYQFLSDLKISRPNLLMRADNFNQNGALVHK